MPEEQEKQAVYITLPKPMALLSGVAYLKRVGDTWTLYYTDDTEESAIIPGQSNGEAQDNPFRIISAVQSRRSQ